MAETPRTDSERSADARNEPAPFSPPSASLIWPNLAGVEVSISLELGRKNFPISSILEWTEGSLLELDRQAGAQIDVLFNGKLCARGEVVTIAENFGVRITEIIADPDAVQKPT